LVEGLPAGRGEGSGELLQAELLAFLRRFQQTKLEALKASRTALGEILKVRGVKVMASPVLPRLIVVVAINDGKIQAFSIACQLILPYQIFLLRINIWIIIKQNGLDVIIKHPLDNGCRTWSATAV